MTKQAKKYTGHFLLLLLIPIIVFCSMSFNSFNEEVQKGRSENLLKLNGTEKNTQNFKITYRFAHGVYVLNARWPETNESPDVIFNDGNYESEICFADKPDKAINITTNSKEITVIPLKAFEGEMLFTNTVCGCEGFAMLPILVTGLVSSLVLILIATGFYYSASKHKTPVI